MKENHGDTESAEFLVLFSLWIPCLSGEIPVNDGLSVF